MSDSVTALVDRIAAGHEDPIRSLVDQIAAQNEVHPDVGDYLHQAGASVAKGALSGTRDLFAAPETLGRATAGLVGPKTQAFAEGMARLTPAHWIARGLGAAASTIEDDPEVQASAPGAAKWLSTTGAGALGQAVPFMATAGAGAAVGLTARGATALTALTGVAANGVQGYEDAEKAGATPEQKFGSMLVNGGLGVLEAAEPALILARWDRRTGGMVGKTLLGAFKISGEKGLMRAASVLGEAATQAGTEGVQQLGGNAYAGLTYDERRQLTDGLADATGGGGFAGALLSVLTGHGPRPGKGTDLTANVREGVDLTGQSGTFAEQTTGAAPVPSSPPSSGPGAAASSNLPESPDSSVLRELSDANKQDVRAVAAPDTPEAKYVQEFASQRGLKVRFVEGATEVHGASTPGTIYVDTKAPLRSVAYHETVHQLGAEVGRLADDLRAMDPEGSAKFEAFYAHEYERATGSRYDAGKLEEEGVAYRAELNAGLVYEALQRPERLRAMLESKPGAWTRIVDAIVRAFQKVGLGVRTSKQRALDALRAEVAGQDASKALDSETAIRVALRIRDAFETLQPRATSESGGTSEATITPLAGSETPETASQTPSDPEVSSTAARATSPAPRIVVAEMPKGAQIGTDLTGEPVYSKVERGDIARPGAGIPQPKIAQPGIFDEVGGLFEKQAYGTETVEPPSRKELLANPAVRESLAAMASEVGTEGVGGQVIRGESDQLGSARGAVIGRTRKTAKAEWWGRRPGDTSPAHVKRAIKKALAGAKLTAQETETVDFLLHEAATGLDPETYRTGTTESQKERAAIQNESKARNRKVPGVPFSVAPRTDSPEFKRWFGESKVVDESGKPSHVYMGAGRPDRVGNKLNPRRATSGPLIFTTEDPAIASRYAEGKADTSIEPPSDYAEWFGYKAPGSRSVRRIDQAWYALTPEERATVMDRFMRANVLDKEDGGRVEVHLLPEGETAVTGRDHWDYVMKHEARRNPLRAMVEVWLSSGNLFNQESAFQELLQTVGLDPNRIVDLDPNQSYPAVFPFYLSVHKPLDTANIPSDVVRALRESAKRKRGRDGDGADSWDKRHISGREWIERLDNDLKDGTTHAWTSVPDWITDTLRSFGYDGIKDTGGKMGGDKHAVWIPFSPSQVKSATGNRGTFDPKNPDIRFSVAPRTDSPEFRRFFGKSKVGTRAKPLRVFTGTPRSFNVFDRSKASPESDFGAGFYFSNTVADVNANYTGLGPDLKNKVDQEAERIASDTGRDYSDPEVIAEAIAKHTEHQGAVLPVYLRIENPFVVGGKNETHLGYTFDEDTETESGPLIDFIEALRTESEEFSDGSVDDLIGSINEEGDVSASRLYELASKDEQFSYYTDDEGRLVSKEILRRALERAGFDGIIDNTVDSKFGSQRRIGQKMEGVGPKTTHYIAFRPEQIKSAIGNRGTFDPKNPDIRFSVAPRNSFDAPDDTRARQFNRALLDSFEALRLTPELDSAISRRPGLAYGRAERVQAQTIRGMIDVAKKVGKEKADQFLYALHAPTRNKIIAERSGGKTGEESNPGSGMTTSEARKIAAEGLKNPDLVRLRDMNRRLNRERLDALEQAGLLSKEQRAEWEKFGPDYVPLRTADDPGSRVAGGSLNVAGPESKRAEGRSTIADSPLSFGVSSFAQAVERAERNKVGQLFADYVEQHPGDQWGIYKSKDAIPEGWEVLSLKRDGEPVYIGTSNEAIASAFKQMDVAKASGVLKVAGVFRRYMHNVIIKYNPPFALSNAFRDMGTAAAKVTITDKAATGARVLKNAPAAMLGSWKALREEGKGGEWGKWYREARDAGALVGWNELGSFQDVEDAISRSKRGAILNAIEQANRGVELGTRVALYEAMRAQGKTQEEAALIARDGTTDFARRGNYSSQLSSLYLFANANLQGTASLWRAVAAHPARGTAVLGALVAMGYLASLASRQLGDDWDDIPDYQKRRMGGVMAGGTLYGVPLPYGFDVFYYLGARAEAAANGRAQEDSIGMDVLEAAIQSFSPVQGADLLQTVTPTIGRPLVEIATNKDFAGNPIRPQQSPFDRTPSPRSEQTFASVDPTLKAATQGLNRATGGDSVRPGAIDVSAEDVEHVLKFLGGGLGSNAQRLITAANKWTSGEPVRKSDIPILRTFMSEVPESAVSNLYYDNLAAIEREVEARKKGEEVLDARALALSTYARNVDGRVRKIRERMKASPELRPTLEPAMRAAMASLNERLAR